MNTLSSTRDMSQEVLLESSTFVSDMRIKRETIRAAILEKEAAIRVIQRSIDDLTKVVNWCDQIIGDDE